MRFSPAIIANRSVAHVPVCDNSQPPRCSDLYHDQSGTPQGDVGSIPVGEYLFDPRAANVSINGQTFVEWYVEEYLFSQSAAGNPKVSTSTDTPDPLTVISPRLGASTLMTIGKVLKRASQGHQR